MTPVMRTVMRMRKLKVRKKIRQAEIAAMKMKMMKWFKLFLLTLVSFATSCFQPKETKNIMKTVSTREIMSAKVHTLANWLIPSVKGFSPARRHCGIIS